MKVGLIEVRPQEGGYVAKEMAGGLGKRVRLDKGYIGKFLEMRLARMFSAPPMVLAQISAICTSVGHEVRAYHTRSIEDVDKGTNLAIILGTMVDYRNEMEFASELRDRFPHLDVVFLGSFPTAMPDIFIAGGNHVIKGDPESAVYDILKNGLPKEKIVESPRTVDLNTLPAPNWEPFIANKYFARRPFSSDRGICVQKSRGCSMSCNYCPYAGIYGKASHYDSDYVIGILRYYREKHNIRYFMFRDPNFGEHQRKFREFMEKLIAENLGITWSCEARLDTFKSDEDLSLMAQAGLRYIITGIEGSNDEVLRQNLRRPIKKADAFRKLEILESNGVTVQTNYILGFPGEEEDSVYETIEYAKDLNTMFATFHIFTPQPGTDIFNQYRKKLLGLDWNEYNYSNLVWKHDTLSKEFLDSMAAHTYSNYYFRSRWFAKHLRQLPKLLM